MILNDVQIIEGLYARHFNLGGCIMNAIWIKTKDHQLYLYPSINDNIYVWIGMRRIYITDLTIGRLFTFIDPYFNKNANDLIQVAIHLRERYQQYYILNEISFVEEFE